MTDGSAATYTHRGGAPLADARVDTLVTPGPTLPFFAWAFGWTWLLQLPALLAMFGVIAGPPERFLLLGLIGGFGPVVAAIIAARGEGGGGVRALFARILIWRMHPVWYVVALGSFAAMYVTGTAVYRLCGGTDAGQWLYLPEAPPHFVAMVLMPLVEEPGWRGFALPRLQARYGALRASLVLGVLWAFWHTTMFILQGTTPLTFALGIVGIAAGSLIYSWIYNHTRGSLLLAVLAHVGVHWNNPFRAPPSNVTPLVVYTVAIVVAACLLVVVDRAVWKGEPARN